MQFLSIIGPMVAIAGLVSASVLPVLPILREQEKERQQMGRISNPLAYSSRPQPPVSAIKRADAGFYFCTNADFQGLCFRDQSPFGTCVTVEDDLLGVPDQFGNTVSSASVDSGSQCVLFRDSKCQGPNVTVAYPGSANLDLNHFNDVMSSFRCNKI